METVRGDQFARLDGDWKVHPANPPELLLRCDGGCATLRTHDTHGFMQTWGNPLEPLGYLTRRLDEVQGARARWIGFVNYELGRCFEPLGTGPKDDLNLPLYAFGLYTQANSPAAFALSPHIVKSSASRSTFSRATYESAVQRVIDYIRAGDVFQVNLAQRFTTALPRQPLSIYQNLMQQNPATFGAFLDFGDFALISNSPELFFRVTRDRKIITRPIKGTRPRGPGMERELLESKKDQAELAMIVDLERNDLGRICEKGSVRVVEPRVIEAHPTVYHGVATIEGQLRDDADFVRILRAMFPCGSVTGAPKIRAMEIIDELEPVKRGPYCGAIGYLADDGTMEFNVAIRTMIVKDGLVHIPVGGGIVADSKPEAEYEETIVKALAMFDALGIDVDDFRSKT